jgi:competence protein ComEA
VDGGFRDWLEGLTRRELVAYGLLACLVVGAAGLWLLRGHPPPPVEMSPRAAPTPVAGPSPAPILVHVAGLVRNPGVYELREGDRVIDAIELAGGALKKAALDLLNLAAPLTDGQQVLVPKRGPAGSSGASAAGAGDVQPTINVNTADAEALQELPGIGEVLSQRILDYREEHGPFATVDDLIQVKGIGEVTLEDLRDLVTV